MNDTVLISKKNSIANIKIAIDAQKYEYLTKYLFKWKLKHIDLLHFIFNQIKN